MHAQPARHRANAARPRTPSARVPAATKQLDRLIQSSKSTRSLTADNSAQWPWPWGHKAETPTPLSYIARALYDFEATEEGELPLTQGEQVYIIARAPATLPDGWLIAHKGSGPDSQQGLVPDSYVAVVAPLKQPTASALASSIAELQQELQAWRPDQVLDGENAKEFAGRLRKMAAWLSPATEPREFVVETLDFPRLTHDAPVADGAAAATPEPLALERGDEGEEQKESTSHPSAAGPELGDEAVDDEMYEEAAAAPEEEDVDAAGSRSDAVIEAVLPMMAASGEAPPPSNLGAFGYTR